MKASLGIAVVTAALTVLASAQNANSNHPSHGTTTYREGKHRVQADVSMQKTAGATQATGKELGQLEKQTDRTLARSSQTRTRPVAASTNSQGASKAAGHNPPINFQYHPSKSAKRTTSKASGRGRSVKHH